MAAMVSLRSSARCSAVSLLLSCLISRASLLPLVGFGFSADGTWTGLAGDPCAAFLRCAVAGVARVLAAGLSFEVATQHHWRLHPFLQGRKGHWCREFPELSPHT